MSISVNRHLIKFCSLLLKKKLNMELQVIELDQKNLEPFL